MTLIAYAKKFLPYLTLNPERVGTTILRIFGTQTGVMGSQQIERVIIAVVYNIHFETKNFMNDFNEYFRVE